MSEFDEQIRDALEAEQTELMTEDEDWESHFEGLKTLFRGNLKWLTYFHLLVMVVLTTMIVVSAIQFFHVESTRAMIAWATGFAVFTILEALVELFFMIEWNKYVVRREVKQLELQVATLVKEIRTSGPDVDQA